MHGMGPVTFTNQRASLTSGIKVKAQGLRFCYRASGEARDRGDFETFQNYGGFGLLRQGGSVTT
jgi:hypothetical protein